MELNENMEMVIRDGVRFLESLTLYYGPKEGMRIWEGIGDVVGADVKGQIFFAMLTGRMSSARVGFLQSPNSDGYAVAVIKAIRGATNMSLKEAKDVWDLAATKRAYVDCLNNDSARALTTALKGFGCLV